MTISIIELIKSINKAYRLVKPKRNELDKFKFNLNRLLYLIDETESEENVKGHLMVFLKNTYYHPDFLVATKGRTDFVIHTEKDAKSHAGVLFEVKRPSNKAEMVTKSNLNTRAMHELILYFLRERLENKNHSLTHLIITNIYEWFVFDANLFERIFTQNKSLQKTYKEWMAGQKVSTNTSLFYTEIAKPFLDELNKEISFTHYDIREYQQFLTDSSNKEDKKLITLYKFFSPIHLLKLPFINDSNSLDKGFFKELLHIIGLEEVKDGGRKIIRRVSIDQRQVGSILENAINILEVENAVSKISDVRFYGENKDEQLFNLGLELTITWVNRILFLKLLEAQLFKYHKGDYEYRFLDMKTIQDYDELYKLFFQVLAKEPKDRTELIKKKYPFIPYLNSSLFEISSLEEKTIRINGLDDNIDLQLYKDSILKKNNLRASQKEMNTLHYLLEFLEAYDFASIGKEEVQEENKTIINAAVLGLVFEKINGYRDGSIYTPSAVTMFLCKETIRKAVVKKFNDAYQWSCETIEDISNYLASRRNTKDILEFNALIEDVKIADPAVGSGHFLVSSLNELIVIKAELGILADENGKVINEIEVSIANDELLVNYADTQDFFEYQIITSSATSNTIGNKEQRIQQTLFNEKRKIIEKCLFGVDINPNSVKICQLRLWIELLKHTYYKQETGFLELETLPNIDINIKTGNSLLNKYSLTEDLTEVFNKGKFGVKDYQANVAAYKDANSKETKEKFSSFIKNIKGQFHETVSRRDPRRKKLSELRGKLALAQNNIDLFGAKLSEEKVEIEVKRISLEITKHEDEIKEIEQNVIYKHAFEWRFEFPEVLDEQGNFEGFEVIIGNPPYIQLQKMGKDADALQTCNYQTFARTGDIYCLFYEQAINLLKPGYFFGYITSNKWMRANYGQTLRNFFLAQSNPLLLVDFGGYQVFENATVDTNLLISQKAPNGGKTQTCLLDKTLGSLENMSVFIRQNTYMVNGFSKETGWVILNEIEARIKRKIEAHGVPLKEWDIQINYGIKTGFNEAFIIDSTTREELLIKCPKADSIISPILRGRDIQKYGNSWTGKYILGLFPSLNIEIDDFLPIKEHLLKFGYERLAQTGEVGSRKNTNNQWFETQDSISYWEDFFKPKIIYPEITKFINFYLDEEDNFFVNNKCFIMTGTHLYFLIAFFNSSIFKFCFLNNFPELLGGTRELRKIFIELIPIKKASDEIDTLLKEKVKTLQGLKNREEYTLSLEQEIDNILFDFYELTKEERDLIGFITI